MKKFITQFVISTVVLFLILGCSPKTVEERITLAEQYLSEGEINSAAIELKNAVSTNLTDPLPRFLLAKIYIKIGDLPSAVKELLKSRELGTNENDLLPLLALSYYHMEEFEAASEVYFNAMSLEKESNSTLALYAYISSLRDSVEGNDIELSNISSILTEQDLLIAEAVEKLEKRDSRAAIELLSQSQSENNLALVLSLKGLAFFYNEQIQESIDSLKEAKALMPVINSSSYLLANAYIKKEDFDQANNQVDEILKAAPENIVANVIKARAEYARKNYDAAILAAEKAIQNGSKSVAARAIAGVSNFNVGKKEQAYTHLNAIYTRKELPLVLYRLLAELQIELGYSNQAKKLLSGVKSSSKEDASYFADLGISFADEGDFLTARNLLGKASEAAPDDTLIKLKKAVVDLNSEPEQSMLGFESVINADPTLDIAWVYLGITKLENEGIDAALKVAAEWKTINEVDGSVLEGVIYDRSGNVEKAEVAYKEALSKNEAHSGANVFLAQLYDKTDRKEQAFDLAEKALHLGANQAQLSPLLLRLGVETKQHLRSVDLFKGAYESDEQNANLLVAYGAALRLAGEIQQAADLLTVNLNQLNGFGFVTLGDSYIDLRQFKKALTAFQQWRQAIPSDPGGYLRAIGLHLIMRDWNKAMNLTDEAENRFPNQVRFTYLKLQQLISSNRLAEAKDYVKKLKELGESSNLLSIMEGDLAFADGKFEKAEQLRSDVLNNKKSFDNVYALASALQMQGKNKQAGTLLDSALDNTEFTIVQQFKLAIMFADIQEYEKAREYYIKLLEINSENSLWLNNLANVEINLEDINSATKYAQAAEKFAVGDSAMFSPYIKATLGKLSHLRGDYSKAYEQYDAAMIEIPNNIQLKFDYMETLLALKFYDKFDDVIRSVRPTNITEQKRLDELRGKRPK